MKAHFDKFRKNLELTQSFSEIVQARHAAVRNAVSAQDSKLIGSLQRKTRIQPIPNTEFDIDILIVLGTFYNWVSAGGVTPDAALDDLLNRVQKSERYASKRPSQDAPAISLNFADNVVVELIPAYIDSIGTRLSGEPYSPKGRAFWIPRHGSWELSDYDFDATFITERNTACDGYLVPFVKILKAIKRIHFPYLKSFALEILAAQNIGYLITAWKVAGVEFSYPGLLRFFFNTIGGDLGLPIKIPGSLTPAINLSVAEQTELQRVFLAIRDHIDMVIALSESQQPARWRELFGEPFPQTM